MGQGEVNALDGRLLEELTSIVSAASAAILAARAGALEVRAKADHSPVTAADHAAEEVILAGLSRVLPGVCVVSEEATGRSPPGTLPAIFLLVDPLDGTRELVAGRDEFAVNVALVSGGRPCLGLIAAPAQRLIWRGIEGRGAERLVLEPGAPANRTRERTAIRTRSFPQAAPTAAVSRSHLDRRTEAFLAGMPTAERVSCGSAIKFCRIAEGSVDVYPRLSTTCEWDVAAGHALLRAAGGTVVTPAGTELAYGATAARFRVPGFVAWGDPDAAMKLGAVLRS